MTQYQPIHEQSSALLAAIPVQIKSVSEASIASCAEQLQNDITKDLKALQMNLVKVLRENIRKEVWMFCSHFIKN